MHAAKYMVHGAWCVVHVWFDPAHPQHVRGVPVICHLSLHVLVCSSARLLVCSSARLLVCSSARLLVCSSARSWTSLQGGILDRSSLGSPAIDWSIAVDPALHPPDFHPTPHRRLSHLGTALPVPLPFPLSHLPSPLSPFPSPLGLIWFCVTFRIF
jgi:hypothetical protein